MTEENKEEGGKVARQFSETITKLSAILGSEKNLMASKRIGATELDSIVDNLLKEEREANSKEVAEQLKALLKGYADLKSEVSKKKKELEKLEEEKMKEFNRTAQNLFQRLEGLDAKTKVYLEGLTNVVGAKPE